MKGSPPPLTLAEARERAQLVTVLGYAISLDLTQGAETFGSTTVLRFRSATPASSTFVELRAESVVSATLNGRRLDPDSYSGNRVTLDRLAEDNELVVEAVLPYTSTGEGMHRYVDPIDGEVYVGAYLGVDNASRVFANFDQPDLKAPIEATVVAPADWTVVGNALGMRLGGDDVASTWAFAATPPISTYLFVVVAGPLHVLETTHRDIPFALYCRRSLAEHLDKDADELFTLTRSCFDRYLELFDEPYPFDSYGQAFVPELNWGAMESPGCITFRDDFVFRSAVTAGERQQRAMVIAHEMAHMWFGDLVTMRWWDDLWLSESFAEFMGYNVLTEATDYTGSWTEFAVARKTWGYDADQRPTTHPVAASSADVGDTETALANFDGISYAKGASAVRQLVAWLGDEVFQAGVNDFLSRHRFGVATLDDLLDSLQASSDDDVRNWAAQWLRTTGVDTLEAAEGRAGGRLAVSHPGVRPHLIAVGLYDLIGDDPPRLGLRARVPVRLDVGSTSTILDLPNAEPGERASDRPDLYLLNDSDLSYCKVRLDPTSWSAMGDALGTLPDPLSRAVAWTTARDMVRDAELAVSDYLALVGRHLPLEDDPAIVHGVLAFARGDVIDRFLAPEHRKAALRGLGDICRAILERTSGTPQVDLRLVAVRGAIDSAMTLDEIGNLRACLEAGTVPEGPTLDSDLRWRILYRLCVLSAVAAGEIDAELSRDTSGSGPEQAARCRAALPRVEAKESAWNDLFGVATVGEGLSTYLVTATARGFWQPEQRVLLAPYVARYFPAAVDVAERRGPAVAQAVVRAGFPRHAVDPSTLQEGMDCLAGAGPTPALRRALTDQVDDLSRALRVRSRSASGRSQNSS
ncbi:MAG TPA: aminopeptidase N [Nocardioidaceae bacterium]|nr:aminopeptidase N [Nocardioidaceae bacterium]